MFLVLLAFGFFIVVDSSMAIIDLWDLKNFLAVDELIYQDIDSLSEAVMRKGDHHIDKPCMACFDKKYITLLEAGGSLKYRELLKPFGLDPSKPDFWFKGLSVIESFIDQIEELN